MLKVFSLTSNNVLVKKIDTFKALIVIKHSMFRQFEPKQI